MFKFVFISYRFHRCRDLGTEH